MKKIMSMHQPNYIPWLGYFYKIAKCDVFVFLDSVQYPRGKSYSARNSIKTPNGSTLLSIPVSIPKGYEGKVKYTDIAFFDEQWKDKHKKSLQLNYKRAPYFEEIYTLFSKSVNRSATLLDLNVNIIESILDYLNIKSKRLFLSDILEDFGQKTDLIINICKKLNANYYLSGTGGGAEYNDEELLKINNISLLYSDFVHPKYNQLWKGFVPNLSILDLLFNYGKESCRILNI